MELNVDMGRNDREKRLEEVLHDIEIIANEGKIIYDKFYNSKSCCVLVKNREPFLLGIAKLRSQDESDLSAGICLALCRAMGWKDYEQKMLELLEDV